MFVSLLFVWFLFCSFVLLYCSGLFFFFTFFSIWCRLVFRTSWPEKNCTSLAQLGRQCQPLKRLHSTVFRSCGGHVSYGKVYFCRLAVYGGNIWGRRDLHPSSQKASLSHSGVYPTLTPSPRFSNWSVYLPFKGLRFRGWKEPGEFNKQASALLVFHLHCTT